MDAEPVPVERLEELADQLFADPLSALTRTRQSLLLLTSALSTFVSFAVLDPQTNKITLLGIEFTVKNAKLLNECLVLLPIYFLMLFVLGLWQNLSSQNSRRLRIRRTIWDTINFWDTTRPKMESDCNADWDRVVVLRRKQSSVQENARTLRMKLAEERGTERESLREQLEKNSEELRKLTEEMQNFDPADPAVKFAEPYLYITEMAKIVRTYDRLQPIQLVIEIGLPIAFAAAAIIMAVRPQVIVLLGKVRW